MPFMLQCLDVPIVHTSDCEAAYPGMISPRMVCAGYMDGGRDACNVRFTIIHYSVNGLRRYKLPLPIRFLTFCVVTPRTWDSHPDVL